jgi:hypothetical protein
MKYLNYFKQVSDYNNFEAVNYVEPNVSFIKENDKLIYNKLYIPVVGDIAYWTGNRVKIVAKHKWDNSLGTPIGVVVIPRGFLKDGKIRITALNYLSGADYEFGPKGVDTGVANGTKFPVYNTSGSLITNTERIAYLPSDSFSGEQCKTDELAYYYGDTHMPYMPSPYNGSEAYSSFYSTTSGNALKDIDGLNNTKILAGLSEAYTAANHALSFNDGASNLQWYLPAIGELVHIIVRSKVIDEGINKVNGTPIMDGNNKMIISSSEYGSDDAYSVETWHGGLYYTNKEQYRAVRPFALLD